jgi:hypothetical protein
MKGRLVNHVDERNGQRGSGKKASGPDRVPMTKDGAGKAFVTGIKLDSPGGFW